MMVGFILIIIDAVDYIIGYSVLQIDVYGIGLIFIAIGFILGIRYHEES
ncbi:MAG: hypothetical protein ACOCSC_01410 [Candidatus Hadarchaeota archaeon]